MTSDPAVSHVTALVVELHKRRGKQRFWGFWRTTRFSDKARRRIIGGGTQLCQVTRPPPSREAKFEAPISVVRAQGFNQHSSSGLGSGPCGSMSFPQPLLFCPEIFYHSLLLPQLISFSYRCFKKRAYSAVVLNLLQCNPFRPHPFVRLYFTTCPGRWRWSKANAIFLFELKNKLRAKCIFHSV